MGPLRYYLRVKVSVFTVLVVYEKVRRMIEYLGIRRMNEVILHAYRPRASIEIKTQKSDFDSKTINDPHIDLTRDRERTVLTRSFSARKKTTENNNVFTG